MTSAMALYTITPFMGPILGPLIGGLVLHINIFPCPYIYIQHRFINQVGCDIALRSGTYPY